MATRKQRPKSGSQRQFERRPVTRFVWFQGVEEPRIEGLGHSVDVSRGGLGLVSSKALPDQAVVMVQIVFDSGAPRSENVNFVISAVARVVYCRPAQHPGTFRMGLEFVVLPPDASRLLAEYFS